MKPQLISILLDRGISLTGAVIALLYGYRLVGKKPGESEPYDKWHNSWGKTLRICGWVMLACFIPLLINDLVRIFG